MASALSADEAEEWRKLNEAEGDCGSRPYHDIQTWMIQNGLTVSEDTYSKLNEHGFVTITDLEQCTVMEMKEYSQKEHMNILIADRIKLQRAVEILGNKARIINPQEIEILKSMAQKTDKLEALLHALNKKQQRIDQQRKSIEMAINFGFNALIDTLDDRKELILKQLHEQMDKRTQSITSSINICTASVNEVTQMRETCQELLNKAITMDELVDRTTTLNEQKTKVMQTISETNKKCRVPSHDKINFVLDTKKAAVFISKLGMFTEVRHKIDSHILTESDKHLLMNTLKSQLNSKIKLSLLYRMSKHGASSRQFHALCDNKGATLTVIKSKKYHHVFGGYTSMDWQTNYVGYHVKDKDAFLFLLRSQFSDKAHVFPGHNECGVYHNVSSGPAFGDSTNCALSVTVKQNQSFDGYVCAQNDAFNMIGNELCGGKAFETKKKRYNFEIEDYEVFKVTLKKRKQKDAEMTWRQFLTETAGDNVAENGK
eukprot:38323_1